MQTVLSRPFYVGLIAVFPVLFVISTNPGQTTDTSSIIAVLGAALAGTLFLCLSRPLLRSWHAAALLTTLAVVLFWSYELAITTYLGDVGREPSAGELRSANIWISALWLAAIVGSGWGLRSRPNHKLSQAAPPLNIAAAVLVATTLSRIWVSGTESEATAAMTPGHAQAQTADPEKRDIYYIILDGYARGDILKKYYDLENPLEEHLKDRGFFVAPSSTANYYWTFLSLASSLNYNYVQSLIGSAIDEAGKDRTAPYRLIRDNAAAEFLKSRGYRFLHVQSTWGGTLYNKFADELIRCGDYAQDELYRTLIDMSWLRIGKSQVSAGLAECHLNQFAALSRLGRNPGPKFVFAHFILPHHPYLFDKSGRILSNATLGNQFQFQKRLWEDKAGYSEQLMFVNELLIKTIDRIVADSRVDPIIIVQSDHGPNLRDNLTLQQQQSIRFPNLSAFHLPAAPDGLIPPDVTPVNIFRHVFNHYFDADLPILPARHFYSEYKTPYMMFEMTGSGAGTLPTDTPPHGRVMTMENTK